MFLGQYTYSIDDKGRLTIPSRFRDELGGRNIVITRGLDRCLTIYPLDVWDEIAQKVNALPITDPRGRALRRIFFADAMNVELDRQGRVLIPDRLREYGGFELSAEIVIVGLDRFLEVWTPQRWEEANIHQAEMMDEDPALWESLKI
ncbi:MAG TPA: division/cell wall cluster transcriptional repressor MraZ [Anaerolineae bacterium]|nr:division/cell wall cluster transcriptional repressor MraZ [Anaerolineae bacterium]HQI86063.1 division/cell wall cluster transcriptional repressor MraZ [Anaerolineae bacterium]